MATNASGIEIDVTKMRDRPSAKGWQDVKKIHTTVVPSDLMSKAKTVEQGLLLTVIWNNEHMSAAGVLNEARKRLVELTKLTEQQVFDGLLDLSTDQHILYDKSTNEVTATEWLSRNYGQDRSRAQYSSPVHLAISQVKSKEMKRALLATIALKDYSRKEEMNWDEILRRHYRRESYIATIEKITTHGKIETKAYGVRIFIKSIRNPIDSYTIGQEIEVVTTRIDRERGLVHAIENPWHMVDEICQVGNQAICTAISQHKEFFQVQIREGLFGLIPLLEMAEAIDRGCPEKIGKYQVIQAEIAVINMEDQRIILKNPVWESVDNLQPEMTLSILQPGQTKETLEKKKGKRTKNNKWGKHSEDYEIHKKAINLSVASVPMAGEYLADEVFDRLMGVYEDWLKESAEDAYKMYIGIPLATIHDSKNYNRDGDINFANTLGIQNITICDVAPKWIWHHASQEQRVRLEEMLGVNCGNRDQLASILSSPLRYLVAMNDGFLKHPINLLHKNTLDFQSSFNIPKSSMYSTDIIGMNKYNDTVPGIYTYPLDIFMGNWRETKEFKNLLKHRRLIINQDALNGKSNLHKYLTEEALAKPCV